jgi:hypothetical protein
VDKQAPLVAGWMLGTAVAHLPLALIRSLTDIDRRLGKLLFEYCGSASVLFVLAVAAIALTGGFDSLLGQPDNAEFYLTTGWLLGGIAGALLLICWLGYKDVVLSVRDPSRAARLQVMTPWGVGRRGWLGHLLRWLRPAETAVSERDVLLSDRQSVLPAKHVFQCLRWYVGLAALWFIWSVGSVVSFYFPLAVKPNSPEARPAQSSPAARTLPAAAPAAPASEPDHAPLTRALQLVEAVDASASYGVIAAILLGHLSLYFARRRIVPNLSVTAAVMVALPGIGLGAFAGHLAALQWHVELWQVGAAGIGLVPLGVVALVTARFAAQLNHRQNAILNARQAAAEQRAVLALAERSASQGHIAALQAQIEPHFLYNTLTNVQLLIRKNAPAADAMTGHLMDYLRSRLSGMRAETSSLGAELDMVRNYLEIIKMRMGERLRFYIHADAALNAAKLPPLMLITLVENSIQHGLEPLRAGGEIHIHAELTTATHPAPHTATHPAPHTALLTVRVRDTGRGLASFADGKPTAGSGLGLANIRERLQLRYGSAASLELGNDTDSTAGVSSTAGTQAAPNPGFCATLIIPQHP